MITKYTGRTIWKWALLLVLVLLLAVLIAQVAHAGGNDWGYPREQELRDTLENFTTQMGAAGLPADSYVFEDGSWMVNGCTPRGLCDDTIGQGYARPRTWVIRRILTNFTRQMRGVGFPADFYIFEDLSWMAWGCLPGALCED